MTRSLSGSARAPLARLASALGATDVAEQGDNRATPVSGAMRLTRNPTQPTRLARPRETRAPFAQEISAAEPIRHRRSFLLVEQVPVKLFRYGYRRAAVRDGLSFVFSFSGSNSRPNVWTISLF